GPREGRVQVVRLPPGLRPLRGDPDPAQAEEAARGPEDAAGAAVTTPRAPGASPRDGRPLADQAGRDRIRADLGATLVVEAASGTGKTTELVRRMVAAIASGAAPLKAM